MKDSDFLKILEDSVMQFKKNKDLFEINAITKFLMETEIKTNDILSHLGNILISECIKNGVGKEKFIDMMSCGWDHLEKQVKKNDR